MKKNKRILITGCAGFIGFSMCKLLLSKKNIKFDIVGVDNLNNYYDPKLKKDRLKILKKNKNFSFFKIDICNSKRVNKLFYNKKFDIVIHLAAQAGVRYSVQFPKKYFDSNLLGFFNILDASKNNKIKHFLYASTSSVYGNNKNFPLEESESTDSPLSFYAATKKSNEVLSHSYSYIYNLPTTALRFFTVYGPFGRPDMALFKFTKNILNNKKIELFNNGNHTRDFTYIDDVCESIFKLMDKIPKDKIKYRVVNIGSNNPQSLKKYISIIRDNLKKDVKVKNLPLQKGDIKKTHASNNKLIKLIKRKPKITIEEGIKSFIKWYNKYYNIES